MELDDLFSHLVAAEARIRKFIVGTPVITNDDADTASGKRVFFKCENLQKTGNHSLRPTTGESYTVTFRRIQGSRSSERGLCVP